MNKDTVKIEPHGELEVVREHGQEWAVCRRCGAEYSLPPGDFRPEQVSGGDGYCEDEAVFDSFESCI